MRSLWFHSLLVFFSRGVGSADCSDDCWRIRSTRHTQTRTHCLMVPVVRALRIHCRSRVLKGISTRLVVLSRSLALSGYMRWCVVFAPTSSSKPVVGAWFILQGEGEDLIASRLFSNDLISIEVYFPPRVSQRCDKLDYLSYSSKRQRQHATPATTTILIKAKRSQKHTRDKNHNGSQSKRRFVTIKGPFAAQQ